MPKIFEYLAYIIRFYTNDHLPIHVHVQLKERESKVEFVFVNGNLILLFKVVKGKVPLTASEAKEVSVFLKSYHKAVIEKWNQVFVYHQKVDCEVISLKLKRTKK